MLIAETMQVETSDDSLGLKIQDTDIKDLIAKAQKNLTLKKAELYQLLAAFDESTPQHYAIALQLRRACRDTSEATQIAEKICCCQQCRQTFSVTSPKFTFNFGKSYCNKCDANVDFDLVDPLPRDTEEVQKRIQERFGN